MSHSDIRGVRIPPASMVPGSSGAEAKCYRCGYHSALRLVEGKFACRRTELCLQRERARAEAREPQVFDD